MGAPMIGARGRLRRRRPRRRARGRRHRRHRRRRGRERAPGARPLATRRSSRRRSRRCRLRRRRGSGRCSSSSRRRHLVRRRPPPARAPRPDVDLRDRARAGVRVHRDELREAHPAVLRPDPAPGARDHGRAAPGHAVPAHRALPRARRATSSTSASTRPLHRVAVAAAQLARRLQTGSLQLYLAYTVTALVVLLVLAR